MSKLYTTPRGYMATIGFFDGVHLGHRHLISQLCSEARRLGFDSMVITFDRHPRQVLCPDHAPRLLTTCDDKLRLLRATGADRIETLHFDRAMAAMTASDFMLITLSERLGVSRLMIGYDNRFGHNRAEGYDDYVAYGRSIGMTVTRYEPLDVDGLRVSSSLVRRLLDEGDIATANRCLGREYAITGRVVEGFKEGRRLGFPTANISPDDPCLLIPRNGVYAVRVTTGGVTIPAVMNIGDNPTFHRAATTLEAHLLDFHSDLYGESVHVTFDSRLRDERRFDSPDELKAQIARDTQAVRAFYGIGHSDTFSHDTHQ